MKKYLSTLVAAILLFLSGCKKKEAEIIYQVSISRNALEYVNMPQGKYRIYKDSASGNTDSVVITTGKLENIFFPLSTGYGIFYTYKIPAYYAESLTLKLESMTSTGIALPWFDGRGMAELPNPILSTDTACIVLYGGESNRTTIVFSQSHSQQSTETMTIEGKTYNNVVAYTYNNGLDLNHPYYLRTVYYWAKGVGIIKRSITTTGGATKTSSLLRNN